MVFAKENTKLLIELPNSQAIISDLFAELECARIKAVYIHPANGVAMFWNSVVRSSYLWNSKSIAIGAASINSMNYSELKSLVIFNYTQEVAESNILYAIVRATFFQLMYILALARIMIEIYIKILNSSAILKILLIPASIIGFLFLLVGLLLIAAMKFLTMISVTMKRKNCFFAAKCAVKAAGSAAFVSHLLREKAAAELLLLTDQFLLRAWWHGFVSANLYRHMDQIADRREMERREPLNHGPSAMARTPKRPKKRTIKEEWEYYQENIFEDGELEYYASHLKVDAKIDRRHAWQIFIDNSELKKRLTTIDYIRVLDKRTNQMASARTESSQFIDDEINSDIITNIYGIAYNDRDIEIENVEELAKEVKERKIGEDEIRSLIPLQPLPELEKSAMRLRDLRKAQSRLLADSSRSNGAIDSMADPEAADMPQGGAAELEEIKREIESIRKEISRQDRDFFRLQYWLNPTSETYCGELIARYSFHIELQKKVATFSHAIERLHDFLGESTENESILYVEEDWIQVATAVKNAIEDAISDLPKNTLPRILFLDPKPLGQDLWPQNGDITQVLGGDWSFTPQFAERLRSLMNDAIARMTRIRLLSLRTILHDYERMVIGWHDHYGY